MHSRHSQIDGRQGAVIVQRKLKVAILASRDYPATLFTQYAATIRKPEDRDLFESLKTAQGLYQAAQDKLLTIGVDPKSHDDLVKKIDTDLYPQFEATQMAAETVLDRNKAAADESTRLIATAVTRAKLGVLVSVGLALVVAFYLGYSLLRAITRPLDRLVGVLDVMRTGDLSHRLNRERNDEFGSVANGFNRMTDELAGLVGQVQQSGVQVNAAVTQIAAMAKEQPATASEIATTTTEIGTTSREISSRSHQLVGRRLRAQAGRAATPGRTCESPSLAIAADRGIAGRLSNPWRDAC